MSLLTEQEIYEMADDGVFLGNVKEITSAIEAKVIEKIKAQGSVAEFGGLRLTPEGTNEFWGWTIGDSADVLVSGTKLYRLPEGD